MARPFLADPAWTNKARTGRQAAINVCIACNQACLDHTFNGKLATCLVNPSACREQEFAVKPAAQSLQVAVDSGAKRILIPMSSVGDIPSVPGELFAKFQTSFYADPVDAVFKALGVD